MKVERFILMALAGVLSQITSLSTTGTEQGVEMTSLARFTPPLSSEQGYVGSESCRDCHKDEHASWHQSYHRTMTQLASPETVLGAFDGSSIRSSGYDFKVSMEGTRHMAQMPDPDWLMYVHQGGKKPPANGIPTTNAPVVMTTGSHHYQTYWVPSARHPGLLHSLPLVYLRQDRKWIPRESAFLIGPEDVRNFFTQWNHHCIRCHSTGGNPGLNLTTGQLETRVGELGISCEACHGPGNNHVDLMRELRREGIPQANVEGGYQIQNPRKLDHRHSSQVCGQCHGVFIFKDEVAYEAATSGPLFKPGDDLEALRQYIRFPNGKDPEARAEFEQNRKFFSERWWDDGTILAGGREYTGLSVSACYTRGEMSCLTCHSMHNSDPNDQLKRTFDGRETCVKCHSEPKYTTEIEQHTFHKPESSGSSCVNCHMPHTTYALFKGIRSHQIQSPSARQSAEHGTPNACNLCHLDKTLAWTGEHLTKRYGQSELEFTKEQREFSAALLWMVKGNAVQRVITAWHAGWPEARAASRTEWIGAALPLLLRDPYGVVRKVAFDSLSRHPGFETLSYDFTAPSRALDDLVRELYRPLYAKTFGSNATEVLVGRDGKFDFTTLSLLLQKRDNRSMTIKE